VVSFILLHERGFNAPASNFMRGLCYHYGVELHNFAPTTISQAATFIGICEGFLGVPISWDLWPHLFRGELFTLAAGGKGKRRPVRAGKLTFALRGRGSGVYPPWNVTTNNTEWDKGWFYLRNDSAALPPYTGKVLDNRPFNWVLRVSDSMRQTKLEPYMEALKTLTKEGLTAAAVLAQCHRRRVIPLMGRALLIYKMAEARTPTHWRGHGCWRNPSPQCTRSRGQGVRWTPRRCCATPTRCCGRPRCIPTTDDGYIELVRNFCQSY
jgi:hypothetical protein